MAPVQHLLCPPRASQASPTCVISAVLSWTGMVPSTPVREYWGSCCCRGGAERRKRGRPWRGSAGAGQQSRQRTRQAQPGWVCRQGPCLHQLHWERRYGEHATPARLTTAPFALSSEVVLSSWSSRGLSLQRREGKGGHGVA